MCVCVCACACMCNSILYYIILYYIILHYITLYLFSVVQKHSSIFCTKQDLAIKGLYTSKINKSLCIYIQLFIYVCTLLSWLEINKVLNLRFSDVNVWWKCTVVQKLKHSLILKFLSSKIGSSVFNLYRIIAKQIIYQFVHDVTCDRWTSDKRAGML